MLTVGPSYFAFVVNHIVVSMEQFETLVWPLIADTLLVCFVFGIMTLTYKCYRLESKL